ncbi:MAG: GHKL domain-containing protein [Chloroflexi bacterium]|nr:GHKL domain-containing protein [Chloroflexota bacterium]
MCPAKEPASAESSGTTPADTITMPRDALAVVQRTIDILHDAVVIVNADLRVQTANRSFYQVFNLVEHETVGVLLYDLGDGQWDNARLRSALESAVAHDADIRDFRLNYNFPRLGEQTIQLNARQLPVSDSQPVLVLAVENVTRQLLATQELQRVNTELIRSNEELERFAFLAAHDLQAPLQTIISYLQLVVERYVGKLGADADDFFQFTINSATHLQEMTRGLLSLARVDQQSPHFERIDCQEVVDEALGNLTPVIEECGAVISNDVLPTVTGDRTQLTRLFQNLIDNAVKFRRDKPPEIHIGVEEREDEWEFSIQDDGIGIEPDYIESLFELFRRAHHRTDYPGSGIGLTIAKKIVEHHGGRIWVESTPGERTVFYFTIARNPRPEAQGT